MLTNCIRELEDYWEAASKIEMGLHDIRILIETNSSNRKILVSGSYEIGRPVGESVNIDDPAMKVLDLDEGLFIEMGWAY